MKTSDAGFASLRRTVFRLRFFEPKNHVFFAAKAMGSFLAKACDGWMAFWQCWSEGEARAH